MKNVFSLFPNLFFLNFMSIADIESFRRTAKGLSQTHSPPNSLSELYRPLSRVPCCTVGPCVLNKAAYTKLYINIYQTPCDPFPSSFPAGNHESLLYVCDSVSVCFVNKLICLSFRFPGCHVFP